MKKPTCLCILFVLLITANIAAGELRSRFCPRTLDRGIYFGPAPKNFSDVQRLQRIGVCEIIDMRPSRPVASQREQRWASRLGVCYRHLPVSLYPAYCDPQIETTLARMRQRRSGAIYVHCTLGRDRTGLIAALYRYRYLGWSAHSAYFEMERRQYNSRLVELDCYFWKSVGSSTQATAHSERR